MLTNDNLMPNAQLLRHILQCVSRSAGARRREFLIRSAKDGLRVERRAIWHQALPERIADLDERFDRHRGVLEQIVVEPGEVISMGFIEN